MLVTEVNEPLPGGSSLLRNAPVQARSSARLTGLLDAAAAIIDEIGFERLTTAMVAERAGASIGTVYRYFPDRIAVVEALAARCLQRLGERIDAGLADERITGWCDAVDIAIDAEVAMYRSEPGFRTVRFGDLETTERLAAEAGADADHAASSGARRVTARRFTTLLIERFGLAPTDELDLAIEVTTEIGSALIARSFAHDREGDPRFIEECRAVVKSCLDRAVVFPA